MMREALYPESLSIHSRKFSYEVLFNKDINLVLEGDVLGLFDKNVCRLDDYKNWNKIEKILIEVSEATKNLNTCRDIIEQMAQNGVKKTHTLIAIGGGAIQDLATLTASLYMRGIYWKFVPTTLMSMMDSCIGGKSSLNSGDFKNIIGNFFPPSEIIVDPLVLDWDNAIAMSNGIAEGLKITFAAGKDCFYEFLQAINKWRVTNDVRYMKRAIFISLLAKKEFVEVDEFDQGVRRHLNFGHTYAHALESATNFQVPHGIAVLIGMTAAIRRVKSPISCGLLLEKIQDEMNLSQFARGKVVQIDHEVLIKAFQRDKKNHNGMQVLILPNELGNLGVYEFTMSRLVLEICTEDLYGALEVLGVSFEIL